MSLSVKFMQCPVLYMICGARAGAGSVPSVVLRTEEEQWHHSIRIRRDDDGLRALATPNDAEIDQSMDEKHHEELVVTQVQ